MSESESENKTRISIWKASRQEYAQEKEFKIDRLHALNKVIPYEGRLFCLDLQGNIHKINLAREKVEKCMMNDQKLPNDRDFKEEKVAPVEEDLALKEAIAPQLQYKQFFEHCLGIGELVLLAHYNEILVLNLATQQWSKEVITFDAKIVDLSLVSKNVAD